MLATAADADAADADADADDADAACCPGEFDAFNTIMAILRMRVKYPDLKPQGYYAKDKEFRDFVDCVPGELEQGAGECG
jgi:hypothetical protein